MDMLKQEQKMICDVYVKGKERCDGKCFIVFFYYIQKVFCNCSDFYSGRLICVNV